jgi:uncharacterized protein DUF6281
MRRILYLGCLVVLCGGCGSSSKGAPTPEARAACGFVVTWHGAVYYGRTFRALPPQGRRIGVAGVPSCRDALGGETGASRAVEVRRLVGIDPGVAIAVDGDTLHAYLARRGSAVLPRP